MGFSPLRAPLLRHLGVAQALRPDPLSAQALRPRPQGLTFRRSQPCECRALDEHHQIKRTIRVRRSMVTRVVSHRGSGAWDCGWGQGFYVISRRALLAV